MTKSMEEVNKERITEKVQGMSEAEMQTIADALPAMILYNALGKKLTEQKEFIEEVSGVFLNRCRQI